MGPKFKCSPLAVLEPVLPLSKFRVNLSRCFLPVQKKRDLLQSAQTKLLIMLGYILLVWRKILEKCCIKK